MVNESCENWNSHSSKTILSGSDGLLHASAQGSTSLLISIPSLLYLILSSFPFSLSLSLSLSVLYHLTSGLLVAPTITTLADRSVPAPSSWTRNSVLILLEASFSSEDLWHRRESTSSINTTEGCLYAATANNVRTVFSPSPIHLDVSDDALMLKNVAPAWWAIAFPISVLPF